MRKLIVAAAALIATGAIAQQQDFSMIPLSVLRCP
jgi:hypothetical protein